MIKVDKTKISQNSKSFLIAEIGINHNGKVKNAIKLIDKAKEAGFDCVKFQTYNTSLMLKSNTPLADYQKINNKKKSNMKLLLEKYSLSYDDFIFLKQYCDNKKIIFMSTPFDLDSAIFLNKIGVKIFKISSGDNDNIPLLSQIKKFKKPIILSTGMSDANKFDQVIKSLNIKRNRLAILHCVSNYPLYLNNSMLGSIQKLREKYNYLIGYSDHTSDNYASIAAICMGAKIIEKHVTLSKKMKGPDHFFSLEAKNFNNYVNLIRDIETSLNSKRSKMNKKEKKLSEISKKGLYFSKNLKTNHILKPEDIIAMRPKKNSISPLDYKKFIGKRLRKNIKMFDMLKKNYFYEKT